jgi:hypothetical protein
MKKIFWIMANYKIYNDELRDSSNRTLGKLYNDEIRDSSNRTVIKIYGDEFRDSSNRTIAKMYNDEVRNSSNSKIASLSDIRRIIDGPGGKSLVAFWLAFLR